MGRIGPSDPARIVEFAEKTASPGLANATHDSAAYRIAEIERHFHNVERWRGKLAVQTATAWADDTLTPYQAISGDDTYGADADDEAQVLGTADTPIIAGSVYFDLHQIFVVDVSHTTPYKLRLVWGIGSMADAITAGQFQKLW